MAEDEQEQTSKASEHFKEFKTKVLTETLLGLENLLAGSKIFEGYGYPYPDKPRGNGIVINGPHGFFFQCYISEGLTPETQEKVLLPYLASIVIPEKLYRKGWGSKIVSIWENALINNGHKGLIFAKSVGLTARGFWTKLGYSHYDMNDWAKKI